MKKRVFFAVALPVLGALLFFGKGFFAESLEQSDAGYIFVSGRNEYEQNGIISIAGTDEPSVLVGGEGLVQDITVDVYRANTEMLLDFLRHDEENNQISKSVDVKNLQKMKTLTVSQYEFVGVAKVSREKVLLPLEEEGIYLLRLASGKKTVFSFVVRSNIGAVIKEGKDELLFWAQDFRTKRSVEGAAVTVYSLEGDVQESQRVVTGKEGITKMGVSEKYDIALVALGKSIAVVPINLRYLNYGSAYETFLAQEARNIFFTFTDRSLYQPGDTIHFKTVLREDDDMRLFAPENKPIFVELASGWGDSRETVSSGTFRTSQYGTLDGEILIPQTIKTGEYYLNVYEDGKKPSNEYYPDSITSILIEYYQKPEFGLDMTLTSPDEVIAGDTISFDLEGKYFSGEALPEGTTVRYSVLQSELEEYDGHSFDVNMKDPFSSRYGYYGGGDEILNDSIALDASGRAQVSIPAVGNNGASAIYTIEAILGENGEQQSLETKNVLVRSGEFGIYRKDFSYGGSVGKEQHIGVALKAFRDVSLANRRIAVSGNVTWWEPNKEVAQEGVFWGYREYQQFSEGIEGWEVSTDEKGEATIVFMPKRSGSYTFILYGKDDRGNDISREISLWVSDTSYTYSSESGVELNIFPDKSQYVPGEEAAFSISSSIPDRDVLITFDREYTHRYRVVSLSGTQALFTEKMIESDMPQMSLFSVSFSQIGLDMASDTILVSAESKRLQVGITPKKSTLQPGENAEVNISTNDANGNPISAEVTVWAIDKAILELSDGGKKDIFETFWGEHARWGYTEYAHSLMGIGMNTAESGGCFSEDTLVKMADGSEKKIKDITPGERVLTKDSETGNDLVSAKVLSTHKQEQEGYMIINDSVKVTGNHILWANGTWKRADHLRKGDILEGFDGGGVPVSSLEWRGEKIFVYNLEVEEKHSYFAGGMFAHNESVFTSMGKGSGVRSVFKDTAYWNPSVVTDKNGSANISFTVPDNLTSWVILAVATTRDTSVGQSSNEITVSKEVIIRPELPRILRVGDIANLSARVQNFSGKQQTFSVSLDFSGAKVSESQHTIVLKDGETRQVFWEVVPERSGEKEKIIFESVSKEDSGAKDVVELTFPVRVPGYWETQSFTGSTEKEYALELHPQSNAEKSSATLEVSSNLVGSLPSAMDYLVEYPYGCIEQTTSRFVPAVLAKEYPELYKKYVKEKNLDAMIQEGIDRLKDMQNNDGGWGWWGGNSDPFISAYVAEYIQRAERLGAKVPEQMKENAKAYFVGGDPKEDERNFSLARIHGENYDQWVMERSIAYAYGKSLFGVKSEPISFLPDFVRPDMAAWAVMANVRNGIKDPEKNKANYLVSIAKQSGNAAYWEAGSENRFGSVEASTAIAIQALLMADFESDRIDRGALYLGENRKQSYWGNTFGTAQTIAALSAHARKTTPLGTSKTYTIFIDGKEFARGTLEKENFSDALVLPVSDMIGKKSSVRLQTEDSEKSLYSVLSVKEFRTGESQAYDRGLLVSRSYRNVRGEGYPAGLGDIVEISLTVENIPEGSKYLVVEDQLPSGLVPINTRLKNEQRQGGMVESPDWFEQREYTQNGVIFSLEESNALKHTFTYRARAAVFGSFSAPPATASLLYRPEIYGRTASGTFFITKEKKELLSSDLKTNRGIGYWAGGILLGIICAIGIFAIVRKRRASLLQKEKKDDFSEMPTESEKKS